MNIEATFLERLKIWRKERELSQKCAAEMLGVSRSYLNQVEKGARVAGKRLVNTFHRIVNTEKIDESREAVKRGDWQKAFHAFIEGASPDSLLLRLIEFQADESKPLAERNEMARMILPVIRRRVAEIQRDLREASLTKKALPPRMRPTGTNRA